MAVTSFAPAAAGLQPYEQWITSSTTWTKPAGVKSVEVTCVGGGGGGPANGFGGSGGYAKRIIDVSDVSSVPVTVGAGGATLTAGGVSSFGSYLTVEGGQIPASSSGTNYVTGGSGGIVTPFFGFDIESWSASYYKASPSVASNSSLFYVNGKLFSLGGSNLSDHHMSSDNGTTWTNFSSATNIYSECEIIYGNGVYMMFNITNNTAYNFQISSNGLNWTTTTLPTTNIKTVVFAHGKFYAFYYGYTNTYYTSTDGVTWGSGQFQSNQYVTGAYGDGNNRLVVMIGSNAIYCTYNGTDWVVSNSAYSLADGGYDSSVIKWSKKNDNSYYAAVTVKSVNRTYRYVYNFNFNALGGVSSVTPQNFTVPNSTDTVYMIGKFAIFRTLRFDFEASQTQTVANSMTAQPAYIPSTGEVWATNSVGSIIYRITANAVTNRFAGQQWGQYVQLKGGVGPSGYAPYSYYVSTYLYTGLNPSPPIEGLAAGASVGGSKTFGEGGGQGGRGYDGVVILRWWA